VDWTILPEGKKKKKT